MFDFISAGDLMVLAIAAVITAAVIAVTERRQSRRQPDQDRTDET